MSILGLCDPIWALGGERRSKFGVFRTLGVNLRPLGLDLKSKIRFRASVISFLALWVTFISCLFCSMVFAYGIFYRKWSRSML